MCDGGRCDCGGVFAEKVGEDVPETANDLQVISLDLGSLYEMFSNKEQDYLKV